MIKILVLLSAVILVTACNNKQETGQTKATLQNLAGIDGCGWILQLEDSSRLEPQNLRDFKVELEEGKKVSIEYSETGAMSICMTGKVVELYQLEER